MTILTIKYTVVLDLSLSLVVAIMLVDDKDDGLAGNTYPFDINVLHEDFAVLPTNDSYVFLVVHDGPRVSTNSFGCLVIAQHTERALLRYRQTALSRHWLRAPSRQHHFSKQ